MLNKANRLSLFSLQIFRMFVVLVSMLALTFLYRWIFIFGHGKHSGWENCLSDFPFGFFQAMRLDLQTSLYFLLPLILFALLLLLFPRKIFVVLSKIWTCVALIIYLILLTVDYYYYAYFSTHFSISTFGIVNDDTQAVFHAIWNDFPTLGALVFLLVASAGLTYFVSFVYRLGFCEKLSRKRLVQYSACCFIPLSVLLMRGTLSTFPLMIEDAYVSKNAFVNDMLTNPVLALNNAYILYASGKRFQTADEMLHEAGYDSAAQLAADYMNIPLDSIHGEPLKYFQCNSGVNPFLQENPPHVIVLQMESMGTNGLSLQSKTVDVLGSLKDELPHCVYFPHFLAETPESTDNALECLLIGNAGSSLTQTAMEKTTILSSTALPFKKAGYETRFITGAKQGWRNINLFLPAQGWDSLEGKESLMNDIPEAKVQDYGVFDEYMFQQILHRLSTASRPQLIFGMSITNHSPHKVPSHYLRPSFAIDSLTGKRLLNTDKQTVEGLTTLRYANDCLGNFIHAVRHSHFADKVIIAVTGDHQFKGFVKSSDSDIYDKYGVPLILYIPDVYRKNLAIDTARRASHRDIFPTLFNLALSNVSYYALGDNIFQEKSGLGQTALTSYLIVSDEGAVNFITKKSYLNQGDSLFTLCEQLPQEQQLKKRHSLSALVSRYLILKSAEQAVP